MVKLQPPIVLASFHSKMPCLLLYHNNFIKILTKYSLFIQVRFDSINIARGIALRDTQSKTAGKMAAVALTEAEAQSLISDEKYFKKVNILFFYFIFFFFLRKFDLIYCKHCCSKQPNQCYPIWRCQRNR